MSGWLDRPGYVALVAFVAGAAVAGLVLFFVLRGDGDGDSGGQARATTTAETTPAATSTAEGTPVAGTATPTPGPSATATAVRSQDPDEALDAFIREELDAEHIGECPQQPAPGGSPEGICSVELYRSEELVTFTLGAPFSEGFGEAVLTRDEEGYWSVDFVEFAPLGESIALGSEAVVFGAGSCLNFREEPSLSTEALWCLVDGTSGRVAEGPVEADGITWWRLEGLGWASAEFLMPTAD